MSIHSKVTTAHRTLCSLAGAGQRCAFFVCLLTLAATLRAQTVTEVLRRVEAGNIQLRALHEEHQAQLQEQKSENTLGETSVEYSPFYLEGEFAESELNVYQDIDFPTKFAARRRVERRQQAANDLAYQALRRDILLQAKEACIDLLAAQQQTALMQRISLAADSLMQVLQQMQQQGAVTQLDINRVRLMNMDAQTKLTEIHTAEHKAHAILQRLSGGTVVERLLDDGSLDSIALLPTPDTRIEVQAAGAEERLAAQRVKVERQGWLPRMTVGYRRAAALGESLHGFQVGGAIPIFSQGGQLRAAKHRQNVARLQQEEARQAAAADIETLTHEMAHLAEALAAYDPNVLRETNELLLRALQLGEITLTDFFTEADVLYRKKLEYIDLEARYRKVVARLAAM